VRIGLYGERDQHCSDAGEANEAALYGMMGFSERLGTRENPAQRKEYDQRSPDDAGETENDFADDRWKMPDLVRGTPGIAETCEAKDDTEESGRYDRWLESVAHRSPKNLTGTPHDSEVRRYRRECRS
jgi:hypothetical protein